VAYALLPDMEQELVTFLAAHASLTPLHGGRVGSEVDTELACLQVTGLGGAMPWPWEGTAEFAVSAWAARDSVTGKTDANLLARTVAAATFDLVGQAVTGGRVIGAAVRLGPLWSPDEETARPRYRIDIALNVMP
jgi:hypothetical protein